MFNKQTISIIIAVIVFLVGLLVINSFDQGERTSEVDPSISSFEECTEAGYPSLDSYPEQCETPDGKRFMRNLPADELQNVISPITAAGTAVCLPHWNTSGPQTLECALGLLEESGMYYVLRDTDPDFENISKIPTGESIEVTGRFIPGSNDKYQSIGTIEVESIIPESIGTEYIEAIDYPPEVRIIDEEYSCAEAGAETDRAGATVERDVAGRTYCVTVVAEGAAGSVFRQYAYATSYESNQTAIFTFSLRFPQCANFPESQSTDCQEGQDNFNPDDLVEGAAKNI